MGGIPNLKDVNVIIFGERDQIPSEIIEEAVKAAGANVLKTQTACFS